MAESLTSRDERKAAQQDGRICALATECLRDLWDCATAYPGLFPPGPFGPTLFSGTALAIAFGSPWADSRLIRITARTALWAFAADWLIDEVATTSREIDAIVEGCAAVAEGAAPTEDVPLEHLLASIRDELTTSTVWPALAPAWRDALRGYVEASAREWRWNAEYACGERSALPTVDEYLANAANFGSHLVNVSHWIAGESVDTLERLRPLSAAGEEVQRALRLVNDLASYERELAAGDLNSLMLGAGREEITRRIDELTDRCERLIEPLEDDHPHAARYLRRQLGYSMGFYGSADYWGDR